LAKALRYCTPVEHRSRDRFGRLYYPDMATALGGKTNCADGIGELYVLVFTNPGVPGSTL